MLSMRVVQVLFILVGIIALFNGLVDINTDLPLGIAYFSLSLACTSIILGFESIIQGNKSTRIAKESRDIANESNTIAVESRNRMETIGNAEIQQCIINIESIRKEYFYGIQEYLLTPAVNRTIVNIGHLQQINIFTTWLNFRNIEKALIYREYMSDEQRLRLFGLHRLLLDNILPNWEHQIVSNESIHQLLMGINILYGHLKDNYNFHEQFYEVLNEYVGWIEPGEEFLEYIARIDRELRAKDLLNLFEPFQ
jgi:hypothetical protein